MNTIYKYPILITERQFITVPEDAKLLHVGLDPTGVPCIWAMVNTYAPSVQRPVFIIGTGGCIPSEFNFNNISVQHIGTFTQGPFVWHVFCL